MLASLLLNLSAILKATKENRWKPLTGISITIGVGVLELLFVVFYQMFSREAALSPVEYFASAQSNRRSFRPTDSSPFRPSSCMQCAASASSTVPSGLTLELLNVTLPTRPTPRAPFA
jgi:hypothetical protein